MKVPANGCTPSEDELFRQFVDLTTHVFWVTELIPEERISYVSPAVEHVLGRPANDFLQDARLWMACIHDDDRDAVHRDFEAWIRDPQGGSYVAEYRIIRPNGEVRWIYDRGRAVHAPDGRLFRAIGIAEDITERKQFEAELKTSHERFRQLADSIPQLIWIADPRVGCIFFNHRWVEYSGAEEGALLGNGWLDYVHPDDHTRAIATWIEATSRERDYNCEFRIRRHDGVYRWFDTRAKPVVDAQSGAVRWYGSNTDIDDARALRETLREEKERFTTIVATAPGVIHSLRQRPDGTSNMPFAGPNIVDIFGVTPADLARDSKLGFGRIHPDDRELVRMAVQRSRETMKPCRLEFRVMHPQKGELWAEVHSAPAIEPDGSVVWHGFLTDITARRRAEEALRISQAQLLAALESGGMGTWTWDIQKDHIWWDDVASKLFDRPVPEDSETAAQAMQNVYREDRASVQHALDQCLMHGKDLHHEFRVVHKDGSIHWLNSLGRLERDRAGRPWRITGVLLDITDRLRAEEQQIRSQKMEALGTLAGGIAHDFNNILLAIAGNTKLAIEDLAPDHPALACLAEIERASARAADLVRRILTFSRQSESERSITQLQPIVADALQLLRATLPAMIQIRAHLAPDVPRVSVDATQIHQIVMNLVTNAAYAVRERQDALIEVTVDTFNVGTDLATPDLHAGRFARISVSDNGKGMDKPTLARIFDPFFTTKPPGQGTGLGLSVVHGIVRNHDGCVTVYSHPGKGSTFHVYLPAADDSVQAPPSPSPATAPGQGERVLYVDDEEPLVYLATRMLERLGYRVSGHSDPEEALRTLTASPREFDVVVTDLSMPRMSGFTLAERMHSVRADIPIILTSGYVRPEDKEAAHAHGIYELILKPNTVEELGQVLAQLFTGLRRDGN